MRCIPGGMHLSFCVGAGSLEDKQSGNAGKDDDQNGMNPCEIDGAKRGDADAYRNHALSCFVAEILAVHQQQCG